MARTVIIHVRNGIATVERHDPGVMVDVLDFDLTDQEHPEYCERKCVNVLFAEEPHNHRSYYKVLTEVAS